MIDWLSVLLNSVWIFGLVVVLAVASYTYWRTGSSMSRCFHDPVFQLGISAGALLLCLAMVGLAESWGWRGAWGILAFLFLIQIWHSWRPKAMTGEE